MGDEANLCSMIDYLDVSNLSFHTVFIMYHRCWGHPGVLFPLHVVCDRADRLDGHGIQNLIVYTIATLYTNMESIRLHVSGWLWCPMPWVHKICKVSGCHLEINSWTSAFRSPLPHCDICTGTASTLPARVSTLRYRDVYPTTRALS